MRMEPKRSLGTTASFSEEGYAAVAKTCSVPEMRTYIRRVVGWLELQICHEGGLNGFTPWFTCEKGVQTFRELTENLLESQANDRSTPSCAFVSGIGGCPPKPEDCSNSAPPPEYHRRRTCGPNDATQSHR